MTNYQLIWDGQPVEADALVYFLQQDKLEHLPESIPAAIRESLEEMKARGQWNAKSGEISVLPTYGQLPAVALCLAGIGPEVNADSLRKAAAGVIQALAKRKLGRVSMSLALDAGTLSADVPAVWAERIAAIREGLELGHFKAHTYARDAKPAFVFEALSLLINEQLLPINEVKELAEIRWEQAGIISQAVIHARKLVNMPGNVLVPEGIAVFAEQLAGQYPAELTVEVLREQALREKQMGALLAVGQGSANPPRMIVLRYQGAPESDRTIALVGKGITFDTGGISLKTAKGMEEMIGDMGGAAAVLGVMQAIARLKPACNILGVIATAENMPSSTAYKPGDIITSYSKRTIEILNTDAEGRVVLADAISYAKELGATELIDLATLTGAILVAFGHEATGAVTNHQPLMDEIKSASVATGEHVWQLPVYQAYKDMIKSEVADVRNATGPHAGSITAGLFLGTFAEQTPWVHLDIAGTSWSEKASGILPKGGTGVMVRTLVHMLLNRQN